MRPCFPRNTRDEDHQEPASMRAESPPESHVDDYRKAVFCQAHPGCQVRVPDEDGRNCNGSTTGEEFDVSAIRQSGSGNPGIHDACSQSAVRNAHSPLGLPLRTQHSHTQMLNLAIQFSRETPLPIVDELSSTGNVASLGNMQPPAWH